MRSRVKHALHLAAGRFPRAAAAYRILRSDRAYTFAGWGMTTRTSRPPWVDRHGAPVEPASASGFLAVDREVRQRVAAGEMRLTQFAHVADVDALLTELQWRHYLVYWSARLAAREGPIDVAECGVCDGLTAFFALRALDGATAHLFDAWAPMKAEHLLASERRLVGKYDYLNVATTKRNLAPFASRTVFHQGFIPEVFSTVELPASLRWIHVDLNASGPTVAALEKLYPLLEPGGVVLFDDYGWIGYEDTREAVDAFLLERGDPFLQFPTGQAMVIKRS